jgi:hypothetical protein
MLPVNYSICQEKKKKENRLFIKSIVNWANFDQITIEFCKLTIEPTHNQFRQSYDLIFITAWFGFIND